MIKGIFVNGCHSYYSFGLRMLKRSVGSPPKDEHLERVPYSSITYDFDELFGNSSYGERQLTYQFDMIQRHDRRAEDSLVRIINSLHWKGRKKLYDDMLPNYYFEVREPTVTYTDDHGIYKLTAVFMASPAMLPKNSKKKYNAGNVVIPDVDENGVVDNRDSTMILNAYSGSIELTPEQADAADADRNGVIDARDATLVSTFYAKASTGAYAGLNIYEAWAEFMNENFGDEGGVY